MDVPGCTGGPPVKLSELIAKLYELQLEHGDVWVMTEWGCRCEAGSRDPEPRFLEEDPWEYRRADSAGVYL